MEAGYKCVHGSIDASKVRELTQKGLGASQIAKAVKSVASLSCPSTSARKLSSAAGGETLSEIAKSYAVDISMISRLSA
jgi:hypothetical protein